MAPRSRATSSLAATRSMATIRAGSARAAPITHREPDAAEPDDGDAGPGRHLGRLEDGADPGRDAAADERGDGRVDAIGQGDGGRLRHHRRLGHRADAAIREDRLAAVRGEDRRAVRHPVAERRGVGARPRPARPARSAPPHGTSHDSATGWPTRSVCTPGPTASTTPAPSWPIAIGVGRGHSPSRTWRSEWQTPDARIRTRTSPARGSASSTVSTTVGLPPRRRTAAATVVTTRLPSQGRPRSTRYGASGARSDRERSHASKR